MPRPNLSPLSRLRRCSLATTVLLWGAAQPALAGDSAIVSVGATVLSKNNCKFKGPTAAILAFGNIDPASNANATATATLTIRCGGASPTVVYALDHDSGLHKTGVNANRAKHATLNEFLAYSLTLTPASGSIAKNTEQVITLTGTITPANFQNATTGAYADTVVLTLSP